MLSCSKLVANLPYAVAATIVLEAFVRLPQLASATVMVQREAAERMMAAPGGKDYGAYSVKLQSLAAPGGHFPVAASNFLPPPRVESTVLRLKRHTRPDEAMLEALFAVADAAFCQRRKTIRNSMRAWFAAHGAPVQLSDSILEQAGIDPASRGEQHGLPAFQNMAALLRQSGFCYSEREH